MSRHALLCSALALLSACPRWDYTSSAAGTFAARSPRCKLQVLSLLPQRSYVELGTFDVHSPWDASMTSLARLRSMVRERACQAGADAILARPDGHGWYSHATVLRWTDEISERADVSATETSPPPASPSPP